ISGKLRDRRFRPSARGGRLERAGGARRCQRQAYAVERGKSLLAVRDLIEIEKQRGIALFVVMAPHRGFEPGHLGWIEGGKVGVAGNRGVGGGRRRDDAGQEPGPSPVGSLPASMHPALPTSPAPALPI